MAVALVAKAVVARFPKQKRPVCGLIIAQKIAAVKIPVAAESLDASGVVAVATQDAADASKLLQFRLVVAKNRVAADAVAKCEAGALHEETIAANP